MRVLFGLLVVLCGATERPIQQEEKDGGFSWSNSLLFAMYLGGGVVSYSSPLASLFVQRVIQCPSFTFLALFYRFCCLQFSNMSMGVLGR